MLKVYGWNVCPHCHSAIEWLNEHKIEFEYLEVEEQPQSVIQQVIDVNGGDDWVVPTLEFNGEWIAGRSFNANFFETLMQRWNLL